MRCVLACLCVVVVSPLLSCAHVRGAAPATPTDPCRGARIELAAVDSACKAGDTRMPAPAEGTLEVVFDPAEVWVRSGGAVTLRAELRNVAGEPLEVYLSPIGGYVTAIVDGEERVDERWIEERMGGLAGTVRPWRVVVEAGGVITADVPVSARVTTLAYEPLEAGGYRVVTGDGGPIPPGEYTLQVYPPLSGDHAIDWVDGWGDRPRIDLPLTVTP